MSETQNFESKTPSIQIERETLKILLVNSQKTLIPIPPLTPKFDGRMEQNFVENTTLQRVSFVVLLDV